LACVLRVSAWVPAHRNCAQSAPRDSQRIGRRIPLSRCKGRPPQWPEKRHAVSQRTRAPHKISIRSRRTDNPVLRGSPCRSRAAEADWPLGPDAAGRFRLPGEDLRNCYCSEEAFGEKVRDLAERTRPRDPYDVVNLYRHGNSRPSASVLRKRP
jgi:hypothetical protein